MAGEAAREPARDGRRAAGHPPGPGLPAQPRSAPISVSSACSRGRRRTPCGTVDDVRTLMEWLAETGSLRMLCATSTLAQGINFPVSSVFLSSRLRAAGDEVGGDRPAGVLEPRRASGSHRSRQRRCGRALSEGADRDALIEFREPEHRGARLAPRGAAGRARGARVAGAALGRALEGSVGRDLPLLFRPSCGRRSRTSMRCSRIPSSS